MRQVFVDSGGFFALLVPEDHNHQSATNLFSRATAEEWRLTTTNAVLFETYALLVNRVRNGRELALGLLDDIQAGGSSIERVKKRDESAALNLLRGHKDKTYSFVDALSFVVMERIGIKEALAYDRHFREYGRFTILQ